MENNEKHIPESLKDSEVEAVAGGAVAINKVICCTCGAEIKLTGPIMGEYYNNNICPRCKGRLKSW